MPAEVEGMMYVGETPWHGIGIELGEPPTIEEAIQHAGLDWTVRLEPAYAKLDGELVALPGQATVRNTDNAVLGVVGTRYTPLQNSAAFEFFAPFVEQKLVTLETAGSLRGGQRIWVLGRITADPIEVVKDDPVEQYVLLSNSHDGTLATRAGMTNIRVVCQNTLNAAHAGSRLLRVKHTANIEDALQEIQKVMDVARRQFIATTEDYKRMAAFGVDAATLERYVKRVFKRREETDEEAEGGHDRLVGNVIPLFEGGRGNNLPRVRGTMWAAYNAVTEYLSHVRGSSRETRLDQLWFGEGNRIGARAFSVANDMMAEAA